MKNLFHVSLCFVVFWVAGFRFRARSRFSISTTFQFDPLNWIPNCNWIHSIQTDFQLIARQLIIINPLRANCPTLKPSNVQSIHHSQIAGNRNYANLCKWSRSRQWRYSNPPPQFQRSRINFNRKSRRVPQPSHTPGCRTQSPLHRIQSTTLVAEPNSDANNIETGFGNQFKLIKPNKQ